MRLLQTLGRAVLVATALDALEWVEIVWDFKFLEKPEDGLRL